MRVRRSPATGAKVLLTIALCVAAAGLVGIGAYATFTGTSSASHGVSTGTLTLTMGAPGTPANRLTVNAVDVAPGDTIQRAVDLVVGGSIDAGSATLGTVASASSLLDADAVNGLQLTLDRCSQPWTEAEPEPGVHTYTCGGTVSAVLASVPVIVVDTALANLDLAAGAVSHLRVTLGLPSSADNSFQGLASTIEYTFSAVQRAGTSR